MAGRAVTDGAAMSVAGLSGLLAAPVAFTIARSLQQGVQESLSLKSSQAAGSLVLLVLIKSLEYGALGAALAWVGKQTWGRAGAHAATGLIIGVVFGAALIAVISGGAAASMATLLPRAINEVIHPVGCALALYASEVMARSATSAGAAIR